MWLIKEDLCVCLYFNPLSACIKQNRSERMRCNNLRFLILRRFRKCVRSGPAWTARYTLKTYTVYFWYDIPHPKYLVRSGSYHTHFRWRQSVGKLRCFMRLVSQTSEVCRSFGAVSVYLVSSHSHQAADQSIYEKQKWRAIIYLIFCM
jgi:hypothetical protein